MYAGYIFDLDGVICFTDQYHYQAWKKLADRLDIYFDEEINNRLRGVSRMDSLEIILERSCKVYTVEEKLAFAEEKNKIYKKLLRKMTPEDLPVDVKTTLKELRKKGCKLAIGSSSKNTKMILERIGLNNFFDAVSDGTNIVNSKPMQVLKGTELIGEDPKIVLLLKMLRLELREPFGVGLTVQVWGRLMNILV